MRRLLSRLDTAYYGISQVFRRLLYGRTLPAVAADQLAFARVLRLLIAGMIPISIVVFVSGLVLWRGWVVIVAGLTMNMAGTLRLFLDDEWNSILSNYEDEKQYPYGPPSYVTRELFADDNPEALDEGEPNEDQFMVRYFYGKRGLIVLFLGFAMGLIGTLIR